MSATNLVKVFAALLFFICSAVKDFVPTTFNSHIVVFVYSCIANLTLQLSGKVLMAKIDKEIKALKDVFAGSKTVQSTRLPN